MLSSKSLSPSYLLSQRQKVVKLFSSNFQHSSRRASCCISRLSRGLTAMNCPVDYQEDPPPSPLPILTPTPHPTLKPTLPFVPLDNPSDVPMKQRLLCPTPSSRGCVETKSHGTRVPSPSRAYKHEPKYEVCDVESHVATNLTPLVARQSRELRLIN